MAGIVGRMLVEDGPMSGRLGLTAEQSKRMGDAFARRLMTAARTEGQAWRDLVEFLVEHQLNHGDQFDTQSGPELARRMLPVMDSLRQFGSGLLSDSREILGPGQTADLDRDLERFREHMDYLEQRMKQWQQGDVEENTNPFAPPPGQEQEESAEQKARRDRRRRRLAAEANANRTVQDLAPDHWREFIRSTASFFDFTDPQTSEAEAIREEFAGQARRIMTDDWRAQARSNRIKYRLVDAARGERDCPSSVWKFRLQQEYDDLTRPVRDLADQFRMRVIALATPQQRASAMAKVTSAATEHGAAVEELELIESLIVQTAGPS